jgi:hypothetical protein
MYVLHSIHARGFEHIGKDFHIVCVVVNYEDFAGRHGCLLKRLCSCSG